jgi:hypothetical protein
MMVFQDRTYIKQCLSVDAALPKNPKQSDCPYDEEKTAEIAGPDEMLGIKPMSRLASK